MLKHWWLTGLAAVALSFAQSGAAQDQVAQEQPSQAQADPAAQLKAFMASLKFRDGEIVIPEAEARFKLDPEFRFLDKADARRVLEQMWGNPPDESVLGMIVPAKPTLDSENSWAVVVTFSDEGHVSDEDAAGADYAAMLKEMQAATKEENAARKQAGYQTVELVGWAVPPHYDSASKKLHWAKELAFEGTDQRTLNYDIRVLGRRGYLSLNAVAAMSELNTVKDGMQRLLPMTEFDAGARYADFDAKTDKLAGYGIAALIGGGIAAKTGLLAKLGVLLLAGKKFIVFIVLGLVAFIGKLFGGKQKKQGTVQ
ncbi:MAG: DUF2167 domain-containing protein [Lysobacteraceae bacterium]|nr:MAG: DUF2167 domain-containing protein [Xanthomonadaceae bacterium]